MIKIGKAKRFQSNPAHTRERIIRKNPSKIAIFNEASVASIQGD